MEAREGPPSPQYRPLARRAWLAQRWIGFTGVLAVAVLGLEVAYLSALSDPTADAVGLGRLVDLSYLVQLSLHVLGAGVFLAWFFRAYSNLCAFGVPFLRHDRGWAVAAWFVPIMSLVWPKRMANDVWRGSEPGAPANDANWLTRPVTPLLHWWWAAWLLSNFADNASARLDATTIEQARTATVVGIVADGLYLLAAVLCILVIRRLTAREEARAGVEVPVLELSEDDRAAAEQRARHGTHGLGRRIAWYAAGAVLVLLAAAAAYSTDGQTSSVKFGVGIGLLAGALVIGIGVVQLVGRIARRRPAVMSGWAALAAVIVMVGAVSARVATEASHDSSGLASSGAVENADASQCPPSFPPGDLPPGYRYDALRPRERRRMVADMQLPQQLAQHTVIVYIEQRSRTAALAIAMPNGGEPDRFVQEAVAGARQDHPGDVRTKPMPNGTLLVTPETYSAIAGDSCWSVTVLGPTERVVRKLVGPVLGS